MARGNNQQSEAANAPTRLTSAGLGVFISIRGSSLGPPVSQPAHRHGAPRNGCDRYSPQGYSAQHESFLGSLKRDMATSFRASAMVG
jgi:hypothetical protein